MFSMLRSFWQEEDGAAAIEYALIASLIALGFTVGATALGGELNRVFNAIVTAIPGG